MRLKKKRLLLASAALAASAGVFFFVFVPIVVDRSLNRVLAGAPDAASARARQLHQRLLVADLHADTLLWERNPLERHARGHVDVPRLIAGNVAVQAFTVVTKTPRAMNIERNDETTDNITPLVISQRWPFPTWSSLKERALHQARRMHRAVSDAGGRLTLLKSAADLARYLERRRNGAQMTAGFLGVEGAHALEGDLSNLDAFYDAGFRMVAPTHFFDNDIAGSAHGVLKGGLTAKGREWVRRMEERRMIVDLAHASVQTIDDVLALATRPVVVSHTGVRGTCDNARNLDDARLKRIAERGGLVGIGYWETAVCGRDARSVARAARYAADLVGVEHVALGSDFDGAVTTPFDTTGVVLVTEALLDAGFTDEEVALIMGGNVVRFLGENLPPS